jgi:hypothetical protein
MTGATLIGAITPSVDALADRARGIIAQHRSSRSEGLALAAPRYTRHGAQQAAASVWI